MMIEENYLECFLNKRIRKGWFQNNISNLKTPNWERNVRGRSQMTSAKYLGFLTPSPPLSVPNPRNLPSFGQNLANPSPSPHYADVICKWPPVNSFVNNPIFLPKFQFSFYTLFTLNLELKIDTFFGQPLHLAVNYLDITGKNKCLLQCLSTQAHSLSH